MSIKKGQLYEGTVTGYKFPNKGKVVTDGHTVWVKGALPGQRVSFVISRKRSGSSEGRLKAVLEKSPLERSEPRCPHFGDCGGCMYQRLPYEEELRLKAGMVRDLIDGVYNDYDFQGIIASPDITGYRNKMEFTFGDECKDGPFSLGLHRRESFHDIVNIRECALVHADINIVRNAVRDYFCRFYEEGRIDFNHMYAHRGYLRHLLVRRNSAGELLIALITTTPDMCDCLDPASEEEIVEGFKNCLLALDLEGSIAGICHVYNNTLSDVVKNEGVHVLYGRDYLIEELLGLRFRVSLFSFFQTNTRGAEVLYEKVREYASESGKCKVIYDLYSGTGTITQMMSPSAGRVIGVEIVEEAVESARDNVALNEISNVDFICGDVTKILCGEQGDSIPSPDMIILDPPREGINPKALARILNYGVNEIVYISCKPTSLANDLTYFKEAGYTLKKAVCVNMFNFTAHIETIVLLQKLNS